MYGLFVGLTTLDIIQYYAGPFGQNDKMAAEETLVCTGGPAANAAVTFSLLGGEAHLVSDIGDSVLSSVIDQELSHHHVQHEIELSKGNRHPITASVLVNTLTGDRAVAGQKPQHSFLSGPFQAPEAQVDVVLSDTYYMPVALPYLQWATEQHIPTVLDGGSWKSGLEQVLPWIRYPVCSERFFPPECTSHDETARFLFQWSNIAAVAITRGEHPLLLYLPDGSVEQIPVTSMGETVDTLGAGDIFHGAFCYYLAEGASLKESLQSAVTIAAKSVCYRGPRAWVKSM
jgi:sugar/nucleoside kinase (ribokinase family)